MIGARTVRAQSVELMLLDAPHWNRALAPTARDRVSVVKFRCDS